MYMQVHHMLWLYTQPVCMSASQSVLRHVKHFLYPWHNMLKLLVYMYQTTRNICTVVVMIIWQLDLQLPMPSVPIATNIVSSNLVHGEVYLIQHFVIKFVSDLRQFVGSLLVLYAETYFPQYVIVYISNYNEYTCTWLANQVTVD